MKITLFIACLIIAFGSLTGCKKYEEDKGIHLKNAKSRLIGTWKLNEIGKPGATNSYSGVYTETFNKDGTYEYNNPSYSGITWRLSSDKSKIIFNTSSAAGNFEDVILKLTNKELWYYVDNGSSVTPYSMEYHFEKQ